MGEGRTETANERAKREYKNGDRIEKIDAIDETSPKRKENQYR